MEKIKVELLQRSTQVGDTGSVEQRTDSILAFLHALKQYLTPEAIESFQPNHLRAMYVKWFQMAQEDLDRADRDIVLHIEFADEPRHRRADEPQAENIVDIFAKRR